MSDVSLPPEMPTGNPEVIKTLQGLLKMAQEGRVVAFAGIGLGPDGSVAMSQALPNGNPVALYVMIGAMHCHIDTMTTILKTFAQKMSVSPILRPFR